MESEIRKRKITSKDDSHNSPKTTQSCNLGQRSVAYRSDKDNVSLVRDGFLSSDEDSFSDAVSSSVQPAQVNCDENSDVTDIEQTQHFLEREHLQVIRDVPQQNMEEPPNNGSICHSTQNSSSSLECLKFLHPLPIVDGDRISLNGCVAPDLSFREGKLYLEYNLDSVRVLFG